MSPDLPEGPDSSAVRVALWRALHLEVDAPPYVFEDAVGLQIADPAGDWRQRPDMDAEGTRGFRAAIVARARYVEDLVADRVEAGVGQYVVLGAGLDTFAQRTASRATGLRVFEIDQPDTQAWKQRRLVELGYRIPDWLTFVPVDFETGMSWFDQLAQTSFRTDQPALLASTGVSMYLTKDAVASSLREIASFAPGSTLVMSFLLPLEGLGEREKASARGAEQGARGEGTPWLSFFSPEEMLELARAAGFATVQHVPSSSLADRYFAGRSDDLRPASGEDFLLASTS